MLTRLMLIAPALLLSTLAFAQTSKPGPTGSDFIFWLLGALLGLVLLMVALTGASMALSGPRRPVSAPAPRQSTTPTEEKAAVC
ncbi:hypothetical protein LJY25_15230 [Hymenobacter sp. BT175]|uniref:hypothetical protein n=1 Tax=Hymenobacter translucens TaxID=2886507 RepID=UPI001D0F1A1E|nr:hypothetical protein [Hymenobacter translucens]MCC2547803.1 hypothetical protein [Hymenobacter translucens]